MQEMLERRVSPSALVALLVLAMVIAGQLLQSQVHLNHDVSYFVRFDKWLLQGRQLGSDLLDGSLPMAWVVSLPAALMVAADLLTEPDALRLVFWVYFLVSVILVGLVLSRSERFGARSAYGWVLGFAVISTLGPGFSFGQREHACVLLSMPYLAAASLRLQSPARLGRPLAITVGLLAGIGFAVKPYFLAVPALVELWLLLQLGWRALFQREESLALALTIMGYVAIVWLVIGDYVWFTIDINLATYWAYDSPSWSVLLERYLIVAQPAFYGLIIALLTRTWSSQHTVLLLAGLGYSASYFVQAKGFVYHAYPVQVCSVTFLVTALVWGLMRCDEQWGALWRPLRVAIMISALIVAVPPLKEVHDGVVRWYFTYNMESGPTGRFRQAIIDLVNQLAPRSDQYFYAFSTHPFPGFPTASYVQAEWSGRCSAQSFVPSFARIDEVRDPIMRDRVLSAAAYQRRIVIEDLERRPPTVVFVDRGRRRLGMNGREFDDVAFYSADPRFRRIWSGYEEVAVIGSQRVFVLRGTDISVAAGN